MFRWILSLIICFSVTAMLGSCDNTPRNVLSHGKMVDFLVDLHKAESVVTTQSSSFANDSLKKTVKQSVMLKHNLSQEQMDTTFAWYGHHIDKYIEVYDDVISRLEKEVNGSSATVEKSEMTVDSLDVWPGASHLKIDENSLNRSIIFEVPINETAMPGDNYSLSAKLLNMPETDRVSLSAMILVEYDDNHGEFIRSSLNREGKLNLKLVTDSTKTVSLISGWLLFDQIPKEPIFVDSISLIRTRVFNAPYNRQAVQRLR